MTSAISKHKYKCSFCTYPNKNSLPLSLSLYGIPFKYTFHVTHVPEFQGWRPHCPWEPPGGARLIALTGPQWLRAEHTQALCQSRPISRPSPTLPTGSSSDHNYLLFGTSSVSCTKAVSRPLEVSFTAWEWTDLNSGPLLWLSGKKPTCNAGDTFRVQSLGLEDPWSRK